jgi:hypothetical protein
MTTLRLTRTARGAVIAVALALVVAAPAAAATPPTRTVRALHPSVIPAGSGCAFDVIGDPQLSPTSHAALQSGGFVAETDFSDGSVTYSVRARGAYVNLETGARFPTVDSWHELDRFYPATGLLVFATEGQTSFTLLPGDMGPLGVVGGNGAFFHIVGTTTATYDTVAGHVTQFFYTGTVTDICAAIS